MRGCDIGPCPLSRKHLVTVAFISRGAGCDHGSRIHDCVRDIAQVTDTPCREGGLGRAHLQMTLSKLPIELFQFLKIPTRYVCEADVIAVTARWLPENQSATISKVAGDINAPDKSSILTARQKRVSKTPIKMLSMLSMLSNDSLTDLDKGGMAAYHRLILRCRAWIEWQFTHGLTRCYYCQSPAITAHAGVPYDRQHTPTYLRAIVSVK